MISGNSGTELTFAKESVTKRARPGEQSARLWAACQRQRQHHQQGVPFTAPAIHWQRWDGGGFSFSMERIHDALHPLQQGDDRWLAGAEGYVLACMEQRTVPADAARAAVLDRAAAALQRMGEGAPPAAHRAAVALERHLQRPLPGLPAGQPHGDFTTANMLVRGGGCWLLDWLDSPLRSPVVDVAKLRQDTRWGWAELMGTAQAGAARAADAAWCSMWQRESWWPWVPILTLWHVLRVMPYTTTGSARRAWATRACAEAEAECTP